MTQIRSSLLVALSLLAFVASGGVFAADNVKVTFKDECHCLKCHAEYRWDAKTDDEEPPASVTSKIEPSDVGAWSGPGGIFTSKSQRKASERKWHAVTGRVTRVKQEPDGDLHIQLVDQDADDGDVNVVVEVPFGDPWCDIRTEVFSWTTRTFPFSLTKGIDLTLEKTPVITVTGKAFYDAFHGGGDTSRNRRNVPPHAKKTTRNVTIWEIHPVMKLEVVSE